MTQSMPFAERLGTVVAMWHLYQEHCALVCSVGRCCLSAAIAVFSHLKTVHCVQHHAFRLNLHVAGVLACSDVRVPSQMRHNIMMLYGL